MTLRALAEHYGARVRAHPVQELLAGVGVAIGVALVFAVLVANTSIGTNARTLVEGIAGSAQLELSARSSDGFGFAVAERVRRLPGVAVASPVLDQRAAVIGPSGRRSVNLVGIEKSITALGGAATRQLDPAILGVLRRGVLLPSAVASAVRIPASGPGPRRVRLALRGSVHDLPVAAVLGESVVGPVADAALAIMPLDRAQALARLPGRVTRVLVVPEHGRVAEVRRGLERLARGQIDVAPVEREVQLLSQAAAPSHQATGLFAAIAAVSGALLVFNAMLLTAPERRRSVAVLRVAAGYTRRDVIALLLFETAVLGTLASLVGLALGTLLARTTFAGAPSFLSFGFAVSGAVSIPLALAVAVGLGGVLVTCLAAAPPLLDLRHDQAVDVVHREAGEAGQRLPRSVRTAMAVAAAWLLLTTVVATWRLPSATIAGIAVLAVATALVVPAACVAATRLAQRIADRMSWHALGLAGDGLQVRTVHASALAAMGAVAVCGCVAIEGAHRDVLRGLDRNFAEFLAGADVWVTVAGPENSLTTEAFLPREVARRVRSVTGVAGVRPYYGGLLDVRDHRVWVIGRSRIPPSQRLHGDRATAQRRLRSGAWVAVSNVLAAEQGAGVGDRLVLPTPAGSRSYRIAAITTNIGWGPGAIIMPASEYRRAWLSPDPSALRIDLAPGADPVAARCRINAALGSATSLRAQTSPERLSQFKAFARDGLERLSQIATMLVVAAGLSLAAGTSAGIWQRRRSLAVLHLSGHPLTELWRVLLLEAGIVLGTGCFAGAVAGAIGHYLLTRWLGLTTGYPAPFETDVAQSFVVIGSVLAIALVLVAIASFAAARVAAKDVPVRMRSHID